MQVYESSDIVVTFAPDVCIHSGVCLRGQPEVFDVRRKRWVRPELASADEVAAQVRRCPSGALQYRMKSQAVYRTLLESAYAAFNARDIDGALAAMHPDVRWANGMEGGFVHGHEAVREYWTRQWGMIDPHVEPTALSVEPDGRIVVDVHQVVRDLEGKVLVDANVQHVYEIGAALVRSMEIRNR